MDPAPPLPTTAGADPDNQPLKKRRTALPNWSDLPPDTLRFIASNLDSTWDYVRFRGVCSTWRSAAAPSDRPSHIPSLLLPYDLSSTARSFFDPSDGRVRTIDLPAARNHLLYATPHGWLVTISKLDTPTDKRESFAVSLLNPITTAQIPLPPLPAQITRLPEQLRGPNDSTQVVLSANPSSSKKVYLALLILSTLVVCRVGGKKWTLFNLGLSCTGCRIMVDVAYFDKKFYVVDVTRGITVITTAARSFKRKYHPPPATRPTVNKLHLVESCGDLLLLERTRMYKPVTVVFRLDRSSSKYNWVRVGEGIGDRALFASVTHSSLSLSTHDFLDCGGRDLVCFAGDEEVVYSVDDSMIESDANICISELVAGIGIEHHPYWQRSGRARITRGKCLTGLTWFIPSLC